MRYSWMSNWAIAIYVMSLAADSLEELVMIRQVYGVTEKFTCATEDDGSALVVNFAPQPFDKPKNRTRTQSGYVEIVIDNSAEEHTGHWESVSSFQYPMGPAFDYRWEDFEEFLTGPYHSGSKTTYGVTLNRRVPDSMVVSVRGLGNIRIRACKSKTHSDKSCSTLISIPAWPSKTVGTRPHADNNCEVTNLSTDYPKNELYAELNQPLFSEYEWRTFSFEWQQNLIVARAYGTKCAFVTNRAQVDLKNKSYHFFLTTSERGRVRLHSFNYFRTTKPNATLYTRSFEQNVPKICIELLVSLCPECELDVNIVPEGNLTERTWTIGKISGGKQPAYGELSTWQIEKLTANLPDFQLGYFKLEISSQTIGNVTEGRWAIDRIRKCPLAAIKEVSAEIPSNAVAGCQKLSYKENTVVTTGIRHASNTFSKLRKFLRKWMNGNQSEKSDLYKGRLFCDRTGCTCAAGYNGSNCENACADGLYGYDCLNVCGHCGLGTCEKKTGLCTGDCEDYYLPPFCQAKPEAPNVVNIGQTSGTLHLLNSPEYKTPKIRGLYFELKTSKEPEIVLRTKSTIPPLFTIDICGLSPGTEYTARTVVEVEVRNGSSVVLTSGVRYFKTSDSAQATLLDLAPSLIGACNTDDENPRIPPSSPFTHSQTPSILQNFKVTSLGKGFVRLEWNLPPYTCTQGIQFEVNIVQVESILQKSPQFVPISQNHSVMHHQREYNIDSDLPTSTCYNISVRTIDTYEPEKEAHALFQVPSSIGFGNGEMPEVSSYGTFIKLKVPAIVNDTANSRILVIVKGKPPCELDIVPKNVRELLRMPDSEPGWIAENVTVRGNSPRNVTIGQDPDDITSEGCPLSPAETYRVVVVLAVNRVDMKIFTTSLEENFVDRTKKSTVWIVVFFILMICFFSLFIWRRKILNATKRIRQQNLQSYSQALRVLVKSTTTCTTQQPPLPESADAELPGMDLTSQIVVWSRHSCLIDVDEFEDYVKDSISSGLLKSQFAMFPRGLNKPSSYGSLPANKPKNRYQNIVACAYHDATRVVLKKISNDSHSDYINANHVQSLDKKWNYIAAQGPSPQTVVDFWRMIWQEKARIVCMLTNITEGQKVKCEQYWPEVVDSKTYGDVVVVTERHDVFADYIYRTFRVSCQRESRKIEHLHFTGWPDHSVPMYPNSVIKYLRRMQELSTGKEPIIVHCSAGIGRTGTIILCDICSRQAIAKKKVDVLAEFKKLRDCRMNLVDNEIQYLFVHVILAELLMPLSTELNCNNELPQATEEMKKQIPQHMERLRAIAWRDKALYFQFSPRSLLPEQLAKNRFPELAPVACNKVYLKRYPTHDTNSDYINAILVDGARAKNQYLASELPLPSTLSDFWRLIAEQRITLVVVLQSPDPHDPTCCDIIPVKRPLNPVPFLKVELKVRSGPEMPPRAVELLLTDTSAGTLRTQRVRVLTCLEWGLGKGGKPPPPIELVELWSASESIHRAEGPTLVLCHDGVTGCGLYLSLSFMLERMAVEGECDVLFAVRAIRRSRAEFMQSEEQFEYLYDAAAKYIESFETYANFS